MRVWYVAGQRLCNFSCPYCVSVGTWAKSNRYDWKDPRDRDVFAAVVDWIGTRSFQIDLRLGSLGEPFASWDFLEQAAWLTRQSNVRFVELVSNGSLLARRLPRLQQRGANLGKLSLWLTYHPGQIPLDRFIANAAAAQEDYGCFVVVNALLFPDNHYLIALLREAAAEAGLRFNLDLGYDPHAPAQASEQETGGGSDSLSAVPTLAEAAASAPSTTGVDARAVAERAVEGTVERLGGDIALTRLALSALRAPLGQPCSAGHDAVFIDIHGDVYRCSRYCALEKDPLGSVLDPGFDLSQPAATWSPCAATDGCCNKEDFLNLAQARSADLRGRDVPSLGWVDA